MPSWVNIWSVTEPFRRLLNRAQQNHFVCLSEPGDWSPERGIPVERTPKFDYLLENPNPIVRCAAAHHFSS
jgi:hypothetical protein